MKKLGRLARTVAPGIESPLEPTLVEEKKSEHVRQHLPWHYIELGGSSSQTAVCDTHGRFWFTPGIVKPASGLVALACPGVIREKRVWYASQLGWPEEADPCRELGIDAIHILANDADAAALGESALRSRDAEKDLVYIALGTGVGSSLVRNRSAQYINIGHAHVGGENVCFGCRARGCLNSVLASAAPPELLHERDYAFIAAALASAIQQQDIGGDITIVLGGGIIRRHPGIVREVARRLPNPVELTKAPGRRNRRPSQGCTISHRDTARRNSACLAPKASRASARLAEVPSRGAEMPERWLEPVLEWAARAVGRGARVARVEALRENPGTRGPWLLHIAHRGREVRALLKTGAAAPGATRLEVGAVSLRDSFATEAAALELAERHRLPAPRLIAADLEGRTGVLAILSTALAGTSRPRDLDIRSLRALGAAAATLHAIPLSPQPHLPLRTRPRQGEDFIAQRRWAARYQAAPESERAAILDEALRAGWPANGLAKRLLAIRTTPLIQAAEERLRELPPPAGETVLVHSDLCGDNTVWRNGGLVGIVDWEGAGAGHYGVDLGNLRMEESLTFGLAAADEILAGWQEASGREAEDIAYWDLVAALNTPTDLSRWAPTLPEATENRDAFLRAALARL